MLVFFPAPVTVPAKWFMYVSRVAFVPWNGHTSSGRIYQAISTDRAEDLRSYGGNCGSPVGAQFHWAIALIALLDMLEDNGGPNAAKGTCQSRNISI